MAAISDFIFISVADQELLALSYNVLGLCSYSFDPKTLFINSLLIFQNSSPTQKGERVLGFEVWFVDTLFLRCAAR